MRRKAILTLPALVLGSTLGAVASGDEGEARVSLDAKDAPVADVVRVLAEAGGYQVVLDPGLSCKLTLKLHQSQWRTALDTTLGACRLGREEEGDILRIAPVAKLREEAAARRRLNEERQTSSPSRLTLFRLSYARARQVAPLLDEILSPSGRVSYDERTNTLIVAY